LFGILGFIGVFLVGLFLGVIFYFLIHRGFFDLSFFKFYLLDSTLVEGPFPLDDLRTVMAPSAAPLAVPVCNFCSSFSLTGAILFYPKVWFVVNLGVQVYSNLGGGLCIYYANLLPDQLERYRWVASAYNYFCPPITWGPIWGPELLP